MLIGSKAFRNLWEDWQRDYQPLQVLKLLLAYIGMPEDLSVKLAIEGGCNAVASTFGVLGAVARRYVGESLLLVPM